MDRVVKLKTKANISPCAQYLHTVFFLIHVHTGPMIIRSLIYTGQGSFYTTITLEPLGNIAVLRPRIDKKGTCKLINHTYVHITKRNASSWSKEMSTNLWAACLRLVLVFKGIEIFQASSCIIRNRSHWWILKIQYILNYYLLPGIEPPRRQQTVRSQAQMKQFTLQILTANGFSESPANGLSSKFAMFKLPFYQGSKTGFYPRRSMQSSDG